MPKYNFIVSMIFFLENKEKFCLGSNFFINTEAVTVGFLQKGVLKDFAKFTGKHLRCSGDWQGFFIERRR